MVKLFTEWLRGIHFDFRPLLAASHKLDIMVGFVEEDVRGCVLGFLPGQELPVHSHAHEHEIFDVLAGCGTMILDGEAVELESGDVVVVPAGVSHGFKNTGRERWLIRATIHQRVYARQALRRAVDKRLGRAPQ